MLKRIWRGWLIVARKIGHVQSQVILTLVYFVAVAPFALVLRLVADPLGLKGTPAWHEPTRPAPGVDAARQQF